MSTVKTARAGRVFKHVNVIVVAAMLLACGAGRNSVFSDGTVGAADHQAIATESNEVAAAPVQTPETTTGAPSLELGWTKYRPQPATQIYYVSSSVGSDAARGDRPETPLKSIAAGLRKLSPGAWLLLRRGDRFDEGIATWVNGLDEQRPTLIGAYGDSAQPRPIIAGTAGPAAFSAQGGGHRPDRIAHIALVSLHFQRQLPESTSAPITPQVGIQVLREGRDLTFDDLMVEGYSVNMVLMGDGEGLSDVTIRGSTIVDAFSDAGHGHSQGIYADRVTRLRIEDSVFDHNGFRDSMPGGFSTIFNHNIYVQGTCVDPILERNIIARGSSHGFQLRPSGIARDNILIANAIAGFVANDNLTPTSSVILEGNIVLHGDTRRLGPEGKNGPRGWGLELLTNRPGKPVGDLIFRDNIIAHAAPPACCAENVGEQYAGLLVDNVIWHWGTAETHGSYVDPHRTVASYQTSIGQPATIEAFLGSARSNRLGSLDERYTALAVKRYIAAGFQGVK